MGKLTGYLKNQKKNILINPSESSFLKLALTSEARKLEKKITDDWEKIL